MPPAPSCAYSLSTANFLRSSSDTLSSAFSFVALRKILLAISTNAQTTGIGFGILGNNLVALLPSGIECLLPAGHAETPLAASLKSDLAEVVSTLSRKLEEFVRDLRGDGVVSSI